MTVDLLHHVKGFVERWANQVVLVRQVDMGGVDQEHRLHFTLEGPLHHADGHARIFGVHGRDQILFR